MALKYETLQKIPKRLKKVEQLFDLASEVVEETEETSKEIESEEPQTAEIEIIPENNNEVQVSNNDENNLPRLFDLTELRHDFVVARRNLMKLMGRCQDLMDGTAGFEIGSMNASQVEAVALLANSITSQIQTVVKLYKDMGEIERLRLPPDLRPQNTTQENGKSGDIVYSGETKSLLDIIKENT